MTNYIRLPLKNAYNVRDLGGYACDGGATCWRTFVRADGLERLDNTDIQFLYDYGVRTVIDLRSDDELAAAPDPDELRAFTDYANIPLISGAAADVTKLTQHTPSGFLPEFYLSIFKNRQETICKVMETIAGAREGGVLFHCAAGKDRTGIVAALLLGLAGVTRADILSNYEITYTHIRQNPIMTDNAYNVPIDYLYSCREYLEPGLEYVNSFGGVYGFLRGIGIGETALGKIKSRITCK